MTHQHQINWPSELTQPAPFQSHSPTSHAAADSIEPRTQEAELQRVTGRIGAAVQKFIQERQRSGQLEFCITELHEFVRKELPTAPASPDRVLRDLKRRGLVNYEVVSRSKAMYRVVT